MDIMTAFIKLGNLVLRTVELRSCNESLFHQKPYAQVTYVHTTTSCDVSRMTKSFVPIFVIVENASVDRVGTSTSRWNIFQVYLYYARVFRPENFAENKPLYHNIKSLKEARQGCGSVV